MEQRWVAFITGGSEGIGYACSAELIKRGHNVCMVSRNKEKLENAKKRLSFGGSGNLLTIPADVSQKEEIQHAVTEAYNYFGRIDVLINSAGSSMSDAISFEAISQKEYERIIRINVDGIFYTTQAVLEIMKKQDSGYILNILSLAAFRAKPGNAPYSASKYAARALTETLIEECHGSGIRISSISPGPVATPIWSYKTTPPTTEKMKTMLCPEEVADVALFLLERPPNVFIKDIQITPWFYTY